LSLALIITLPTRAALSHFRFALALFAVALVAALAVALNLWSAKKKK
jgi:hypothetical protein